MIRKPCFASSLTAFAAILVMAAPAAIAADAYPSRPIRIIVPTPPGGSADITSRLVAQKMGEKLGQAVIVENRPGGDTILGTRLVKDAPADGYTILQQGNSFSTLPFLKREPGYEPLKDFIPLGPMIRGPVVIEVGGDQPDRTFKDFVARAKSTPLMLATPGTGSSPHIAAEMMMKKANIKMTHVPYKGASATYPDVVAGRVHLLVDGYAGSAPYIKAGKMRPLAITGSERIGPLPDVPTLVEQGIDVVFLYWIGLVVKAGTPKEIVQALSDALKFALGSKDLQERFRADGVDPTFMSVPEFTDYVTKEIAMIGKLAEELQFVKD